MDTINHYITLLTFIPWLFIFSIRTIRHLNNDDYHKFSWNYCKQHFWDIFRMDILILILFFFFFASYKMQFVNKYLFPVMCIYLCANSFYEQKKKFSKDFFKKNIGNIILLFCFMIVPILFYEIKKDLDLTYKIMLLSLFLDYFLIIFACSITSLFKKFLKKKK